MALHCRDPSIAFSRLSVGRHALKNTMEASHLPTILTVGSNEFIQFVPTLDEGACACSTLNNVESKHVGTVVESEVPHFLYYADRSK